jgi:spore germination protein GerM
MCCLVAGACGFPEQREARPLSSADIPAALRADGSEAAPPPTDTEGATVWFVSDDVLVPVRHEVATPASPDLVTADLLLGPTEREQERGLRSAVPDPAVVNGVSLERGVASVDLAPSFGDISPGDQLLAVGQFVLTLTDTRGVGSVQFQLDGEPIVVPVPTGEASEGPIFRDQFLDLRFAAES